MQGSDVVYVEKTHYPAGYRSYDHYNKSAQLIYPSHGVMRIETEAGLWVVPHLGACWLPAGQSHIVTTRSAMEMHSVYVSCQIALGRLPKKGTMLSISTLLRALILWVEERPSEDIGKRIHTSTCTALIDHLVVECKSEQRTLRLPILRDTSLAPIESALSNNVTDKTSFSTWASRLSISTRSLSRKFAAFGMGFVDYRSQAKLFRSIELLADGGTVTNVSHELGYPNASAFIAAFKAATGQTPGKYFSDYGDS